MDDTLEPNKDGRDLMILCFAVIMATLGGTLLMAWLGGTDDQANERSSKSGQARATVRGKSPTPVRRQKPGCSRGNENESSRQREDAPGSTYPVEWTPQNVADFMRKEGFGEHAKRFEQEAINGATLRDLTERCAFGFLFGPTGSSHFCLYSDLKDIGASKLGIRKQLKKRIKILFEKPGDEVSPVAAAFSS